MRRLAGQAAHGLLRTLHAALSIAFGFAVIVTIAAGALAWRLSQGPIDLGELTPRLEAKLNAEAAAMRLHFDSVELAWEGWRGGVDRPIDLRLLGVTATTAGGTELARIPRAELSLSFGWLLLGRIVPRAIDIEGAHLHAVRTPDGTLALAPAERASLGENVGAESAAPDELGTPLAELLAELARPWQNDRSEVRAGHPRWTQLRRVRISNAELILDDRRSGVVWRAPRADFDLRRQRQGGVTASADLSLALAGQYLAFAAEAVLPAAREGARIRVHFAPLSPPALARAIPALAPLGAVQLSVQGSLHLDLDADFGLRAASLQAELGQGQVQVGQGAVPILGATLDLQATTGHVQLNVLRSVLAGPNGAGPVVQASGELDRTGAGLLGQLRAELDQVPMADLARYWPAGVATGARNWVTRNVTAGVAHGAHAALTFQAAEDGSGLELTRASAELSGDDLTVHWLRPVPPAEHVKAELTLLSPDALVIATQGGREARSGQGSIVARGGSIKVSGMTRNDQYGAIDLELAGSVPDALALLAQPRLHLLDKHPMELHDPAGQMTAAVSLNLLLDERVTFDAIPIRVEGQLSGLHLGRALAGRDLDDGRLDFDADNDGLRLAGAADLAGIRSDLTAQMDFRAGPATQVMRRYTVAATASARQLAALGIDPGDAVKGSLGLQATMLERRSGAGEASIQADLQSCDLALAPLGWRKPSGKPATAAARIMLDHDRIAGIDQVTLQGEGVSLAGAVSYAAGGPQLVHLDRLLVGDTRGSGEIRLAAAPGDPLRLTFSGSSLDLSARLAEPATANKDGAERPWIADLKFDRVRLGEKRMLADLTAHVQDDGRLVREARIEAHAGGSNAFRAWIVPDAGGGGRALVAEAADAGAVLRAFNIINTIDGGALVVSARYDDSTPAHPLSGTAEITSFRLRDAPAASRVLQAMTLYGLIGALRGPGLGVSRLVAPFRLDGDVLELDDARAFSPSLGLTARGRIDLARGLAEVQGTIVPAYFFNSMLGRIPVLGNLFSPEKGGGLFAATYSVQGRLDDPAVRVNPLAALTPGFLRGLFGILPGSEPMRSAAQP